MNVEKGMYTGLADLSDGKGNKIEVKDLGDFARKLNSKVDNEPKKSIDNIFLSDIRPVENVYQKPEAKNNLPDALQGKDWDELYRLDELETVRQKFPALYDKLKSEKFKKLD